QGVEPQARPHAQICLASLPFGPRQTLLKGSPFVPRSLSEASRRLVGVPQQLSGHQLSPRGGSDWGGGGTVIAPPQPSHITQTRSLSVPVSSLPHRRCASKKTTSRSASVRMVATH